MSDFDKLFKLSVISVLVSQALSVSAEENYDGNNDEQEIIIVKGTKIERALSDTVDGVSVFTEDDFIEQPTFEYQDLFNLAPNVYPTFGGEGFGIRGITQNSAATGGGIAPNSTLYMDGVALTGFASRFGPMNLWDVDQVAILKGPQSSNVGRSALAGAVVVSTKKPTLNSNEYGVRFGLGSFNRLNLAGIANLETGDNSSLRLTYEGVSNDGYIENITLNQDDYDARDNNTYRLKWLYQPTDAITALVSFQHAETERGQDLFVVELSESLEARQSSANLQANEDYEADLISVDISYKIDDAWTLTSVTAYLDGEYDRFDDDDETSVGGEAFRARVAVDENISEELRLNYQDDQLRGVIGAYYLNIESDNDTTGFVRIDPATVGVPETLLPFYPANVELNTLATFVGDTKNYAFFTEWFYQLNDKWSVFAGFRYDTEEQDNITGVNNTLVDATILPDPVLAGQLVGGGQLGALVEAGVAQVNAALLSQLQPTQEITATEYTASLPQLGLTYALDPKSTLSFFVKQGYRSGGAEVDLTGNLNEYDPEFLTNYEIAFRSALLDNKLVISSNIFYSDWEDQQVTIFRNNNIFDTIIENSGESELSGIELALNYEASDSLSSFFNIGYSEAEFTKFISTEGDLSGNRFAYAPRVTAALGGNYAINNNWLLSGNLSYQSDSYSDVQNTILLDSRVLLNLRLGYETETYRVNFYGRNLSDEVYEYSRGPGLATDEQTGDVLTISRLGAPREVGIEFDYYL